MAVPTRCAMELWLRSGRSLVVRGALDLVWYDIVKSQTGSSRSTKAFLLAGH
jgi:hypothetical protein